MLQLFDVNSDNSVDQRELVMGLAVLRETAPADGSFCYVRSRAHPFPPFLNKYIIGCSGIVLKPFKP